MQNITQNLQYIDLFFNKSISPEISVNNLYNPIIKVGFLGQIENIFDRMFVAEESKHMVIFVKNVTSSTTGKNKRAVYIIIRRKLKYIHLFNGNIINDIFEYSWYEPEETKKNIYFQYNDERYESIADVYNIDNDFKSKTKIFTNDDQEISSDLFDYFSLFRDEIQYKLVYYVEDDSINYFHVMMHISQNFGVINIDFFRILQLNPEETTNKIISSRMHNPDSKKKVSSSKKETSSSETEILSLSETLASEKYLQTKKITVAWFLCEVMYNFFFQ